MTRLNNIQYQEYQRAQQMARFFAKSKSICSNIEPFRNEVADFFLNLEQVSIQAAIKEKKGTGITIQKRELKKALAREAAEICALATAFATTTNNNILKYQFRFTYSALYTLKDGDILTVITNIITAITPLLTNKHFQGYGISHTELSSIEEKATRFNDSIRNATVINNNSELASRYITNALKKIKGNITQFNRLLPLFKKNHPGFIEDFRQAIRMGTAIVHHNAIEGAISDSNTGEPVQLVTITAGGKNKTATTNASGYYRIVGIKTGIQKLAITAEGYLSQTINVKIIRGKTIHLNIHLEAILVELSKAKVA